MDWLLCRYDGPIEYRSSLFESARTFVINKRCLSPLGTIRYRDDSVKAQPQKLLSSIISMDRSVL